MFGGGYFLGGFWGEKTKFNLFLFYSNNCKLLLFLLKQLCLHCLSLAVPRLFYWLTTTTAPPPFPYITPVWHTGTTRLRRRCTTARWWTVGRLCWVCVGRGLCACWSRCRPCFDWPRTRTSPAYPCARPTLAETGPRSSTASSTRPSPWFCPASSYLAAT